MEVNEQSVVTQDNYEEIKKMLLSNDDASKNLALTILEQSDYEKSELYIMCVIKDCFRESFGSVEKFAEMSPVLSEKIAQKLSEEDVDMAKLSFKEIHRMVMKKGDLEEVEFVMTIFRDELIELLSEMQFEFVEYTDVLVKPKGWEQANKEKIASLEAKIEELKLGVING